LLGPHGAQTAHQLVEDGWSPNHVFVLPDMLVAMPAALAGIDNLRSLTLRENAVDDGGVAVVGDCNSLVSLDLSGNQIGEAGCRAIARLNNLTSLDLTGCQIGDEGALELAGFASFGKLEKLNVTGNRIGDPGLTAIGTISSLKALELNENQFDQKGADSIGGLSNLEEFTLFQSPAPSPETFKGLKSLKSLETAYFTITDGHCAVFAEHNSLERLVVQDNHNITDAGALELGKLTHLSTLFVLECPFSIDGIRHIGKIKTLENLSLDLHIDGNSGNTILDALSSLADLRELVIANAMSPKPNNQIVESSAQFLGGLKNLRRLQLSRIGIGDRGVSMINQLESLTYLHLRQANIGDNGALSIAKMLIYSSLSLATT
jgi:Leucine-rich repeat (LRR) protein